MTTGLNKARRLWTFIKPYWHLELVTLLVMIILAGLMLAMPGAVQYMIDTLIPNLVSQAEAGVDFRPIVYFGLFLMGIFLGQVVFSCIRDYLAAQVGANIIATMRSRLFAHLERLSLGFYQRHQVGEMMSRFLSDINNVQGLLITTLLVFLTNVIMLTAIFIYLIRIDWVLTLVAIIPVPLTIVMVKRFGLKLNAINRSLQETIAALSARLQETFLSIKTVKAFGRENHEQAQVDAVVNKLTGLYIRNSVTTSIATYGVNFLNMLGPVIVLAWGTYLVASGAMQLGALIAFYMLLTYLYSPIQGLASVHIEVKRAMASVDRVFEYFDLPTTIRETDHPVSVENPQGEIIIRNLCFSYPDSSFGIEGLNLHIRSREKIAIVGPSGSGKTTLINLLMRFYDPIDGEILFDGIDLRQLSLQSLRDHIALVDQEPLLFKTSIFGNIAYSHPKASREDIIAAAKVANIHDFIETLPNRYDSEVGERGVTLSGGEKQRICLARAILKNPAVIILDEATSALDSNSERLIQEALSKILEDKTAIIIAHRLSTIEHADRIITIDRGCIRDEGTHAELLQNSALYRELAQKQFKT
ncbi:MAG: ABC transporter ATP-binding protein [candidate division Zixibacteria bacterium]|nr:ABC transporter ATP-binding protein [candidate division Zixibacteria bacterium]